MLRHDISPVSPLRARELQSAEAPLFFHYYAQNDAAHFAAKVPTTHFRLRRLPLRFRLLLFHTSAAYHAVTLFRYFATCCRHYYAAILRFSPHIDDAVTCRVMPMMFIFLLHDTPIHRRRIRLRCFDYLLRHAAPCRYALCFCRRLITHDMR